MKVEYLHPWESKPWMADARTTLVDDLCDAWGIERIDDSIGPQATAALEAYEFAIRADVSIRYSADGGNA